MGRFCVCVLFLAYLLSVTATPKSLVEKYDAKSVGHHDIIKAGVEPIVSENCQGDSAFQSSGANITFNVVCGRKPKRQVIGACKWHLPSAISEGYAKFDEKQTGLDPNGAVDDTEKPTCGCGIDYDFLSDVDFLCSGLKIEGPTEHVVILATSPTKLYVNAGSQVDFWIEYILSETDPANSSAKGDHSLFITHWYNTVFSKGSWHVVHSYPEAEGDLPMESNELQPGKSVYRAYMHIDSATIDETGVYTFDLHYHGLAITLAFLLNVRTDSTQLSFFVRKPPTGTSDYDPFAQINPRFLEADSEYEIVCVATIGDHDPAREHKLALHLYRTPCTKDQSGNTVCTGDGNLKVPLIELTQETVQRLDPANGRNYTYKVSGRYIVITYKVIALEPGVYDCAVTSANDPSSPTIRDTADSLRFVPTDIPGALEKRAAQVTATPASHDPSVDQDTFYEGDQIVFECRYQSLDYRFQRWQFVGNLNHVKITHNTSRYTIEQGRGSMPYSAAFSRLTVSKAQAGHDSGKYICTLSDLHSGGRTLDVQKIIRVQHPVAPKFADEELPLALTMDVNETDSLTLTCHLKPEADPPPQILWLKDGQPLSDLFIYQHTMQVAVLGRTAEEDSGNYSCEVRNRAGVIRRAFLVNVLSRDGRLDHSIQGAAGSQQSLIAVLCVLAAFVVVLTAILASMGLKSYRRRKRLSELHYQFITSTKDTVEPLDPSLPVNQQPEKLPYDSQYAIRKERLVLGIILGEGQFGKVLDGYVFSEDGERSIHVAVKVPKDGMDVQQQKMLLSEFKIMAYVGNHVNVLSLVAAVIHRMPKGELYVASEYCEHGSLRTYLIQRRSTFHNELDSGVEKNGYILSNEFIRKSRSNAGLSTAMTDPVLGQVDTLEDKALSTTDLLSFAYQVANGMDYLASKNVVHRDLALRNVLLTKDRLIKIGDFGLALQRLDARASTEVKSNVPLPAKWMALESIMYGEYSVQSDIWSFGVVLWEIFSLAETPYPGKAPSAELGEWLHAGNRLPPPQYAPEEMYHLMTKCWREQPHERPSFVECRDEIGIDLHLRSQQALESLQNLLNSYHAYVNIQGSIISDESSPTARLLPSKPILDRFSIETETRRPSQMTAAENLEYNLSVPTDTVVAVENLNYSSDQPLKRPDWV